MNIYRPREHGHALLKLAALTLPLLVVLGCSSASSGHAPGVAGGQNLTPGITNYPLAYVKRPAPPAPPTTQTPDINVLDLITSTAGGDLYVRNQANAAGAETNVTASITQGMGDVRDLDVSPDGSKLVFSLRLPLNPNKPNTDVSQPNWHIYQYDAKAKTVTQLTNDDITAGHDVGAHYLPDGRIVFSSTRQLATQSILLDEGRPQYQSVTNNGPEEQAIFLLHVMNADGTQMHQITFNTNHDFAPSLLSNGQIVFFALGAHQRRQSDQPVPGQPGRHRRRALLRSEQPRDRRQYRRHEQQRHSIPQRAAAARRDSARHRQAAPGHAAGRGHRANQRRELRRNPSAVLPHGHRRHRPDQRHHPGGHHGCEPALPGRTICVGVSAV